MKAIHKKMTKTLATTLLALMVSGLATGNAMANKGIKLSYLNIDGLHSTSSGVTFAAAGFSGSKVYAIYPGGVTYDFADGLAGPIDITNDSAGNLYVSNFNDASVSKITPDGVVSKFADVLPGPAGIVADANDNIYVSHYGTGFGDGNTVLKITPEGEVSTFAEGGDLMAPVGTAIDEYGHIYTANFNDGRVVKISPNGSQTLLAEIPSEVGYAIGHLAYADGKLYATGIVDQTIYVINKKGKVKERGRRVEEGKFPNGITYDSVDNQVLFTYAFGKVAELEQIPLKD